MWKNNKINKQKNKRLIGAFFALTLYCLLIGFGYTNFGIYINISLIILGIALFFSYMVSIHKEYHKLYKLTVVVLYISFVVIIVMIAITKSGILEHLDSVESIVHFIQKENPTYTKLLFVLIEFLQVTFIPIPSSIVTGAGAIIFPTQFEAILYSCLGLWIGSIVAFFIGRVFGLNAAKWILGGDTLRKYYEMINGKDKLLLFYMFILPVFPDDVLCIVAGLTSMSFPAFLLMQLISRPLNVALTVYMVEIFKIIPFSGWGIAVWILIGLAILALMIVFWKFSPLFEKNLLKFINYLSKRNVIMYSKTDIKPYHKKNNMLEKRVYASDPYDNNSKLKKDISALLAQNETRFLEVESILNEDDGNIKSKF